MAVKSSTNPDAVIFDYFGYTYEIIDENKKEVALIGAADAPERCVIPKMVEYNGEIYSVTAIKQRKLTYKKSGGSSMFSPLIEVDSYPLSPFAGIREFGGVIVNNKISEIVLPSTIKHFFDGAFSDCYKLNKINIPEAITEIPSSAFHRCESLESIEIPQGVTRIGDFAFEDCKSLKNIKIPQGVTKIGTQTFNRCKSLENIEIHSFVVSIDNCGFSDIPNLKVKIYNEEGEVLIHPHAFESDAKIEYLGKKNAPQQESGKTKTPKAETKQEETTAPVIDLDKLINAVVADGVVTDKEREVILKKAKTAGYDVDEVEILLDGKLAEKHAQNTPATVVEEKEEEKVVFTPKAEPTTKKEFPKTEDEVLSAEENEVKNRLTTRDYSKYSINGEGSYGKGRMVEAVVNKYVELNPSITIDELKKIFPDYLQGRILIEPSREAITDMKRFYESSLPNGTKFYISNQWGTQIDVFIKHVNSAIEDITVTKL